MVEYCPTKIIKIVNYLYFMLSGTYQHRLNFEEKNSIINEKTCINYSILDSKSSEKANDLTKM